jgi:uncharacterized protein
MKKIIVDGHNLIPKIPGLHLNDADDEMRLIEILQEYCRLARRSAEVFFDGSPDPQTESRKRGLVHVHFIRVGHPADDAIIQFVRAHAKEKLNLLVVSSDHRIQNEARSIGCEVIQAEGFVREMNSIFSSEAALQHTKEKTPTPAEIEEWMELFGKGKNS